MRPIFIMSSERSGTNLLRRILGAHPQVDAPPPPHMWKHLTNVIESYGSFSDGEALPAIIDDARYLVSIPGAYTEWDEVPTAQEVVPLIEGSSISHVVLAMYDAHARRKGKTAWVCKENDLFAYAFDIARVRPEARFIYLVRDGRDVLASLRRVPHHKNRTLEDARRWRDEQRACLRVHQALAPEGASIRVGYHELVREPEQTIREILEFVGLPYDPRVLSFHRAASARSEAKRTELWENLARPIMKDNNGKFRTEVPPVDVWAFERVAGKTLERLGYDRDYPDDDRPLSRVDKIRLRLRHDVKELWPFSTSGTTEPARRAQRKGMKIFRERTEERMMRLTESATRR